MGKPVVPRFFAFNESEFRSQRKQRKEMSEYKRDIAMSLEHVFYPTCRIDASKIGDAILVFSPIARNETDERWCATLIDCFYGKAISVILADKAERFRFEKGFDEMDEETEDAAFCRSKVDAAIKRNESEPIKASNFLC